MTSINSNTCSEMHKQHDIDPENSYILMEGDEAQKRLDFQHKLVQKILLNAFLTLTV